MECVMERKHVNNQFRRPRRPKRHRVVNSVNSTEISNNRVQEIQSENIMNILEKPVKPNEFTKKLFKELYAQSHRKNEV